MPKPGMRLKILKAIRRQGHRYDLLRVVSQVTSLGILLAVPLSGIARVDLWRGDHRLWFAAVPLRHGIGGVILAISLLYVVTFLSNVAAGRIFCGWGCPVGQVSRFGERLDTARLTGRDRLAAHLKGAAFSLLLVVSFLVWWVDLRVLWLGSGSALASAWGILITSTFLAYAHGRWWQWGFCKSACPIGLYYSFVSPASWYGVYFRNAESSCIECNACDNACPVDLAPRDLMVPIAARSGVSVADAPGRNHCLECGDCVRACEFMIEAGGDGPVPLLLGHYSGSQRVLAAKEDLGTPE
jgi:polyferredoxin